MAAQLIVIIVALTHVYSEVFMYPALRKMYKEIELLYSRARLSVSTSCRNQPFKLPYTHPTLFKLYHQLCIVNINGKKISGAATTAKTGEAEKPYE